MRQRYLETNELLKAVLPQYVAQHENESTTLVVLFNELWAIARMSLLAWPFEHMWDLDKALRNGYRQRWLHRLYGMVRTEHWDKTVEYVFQWLVETERPASRDGRARAEYQRWTTELLFELAEAALPRLDGRWLTAGDLFYFLRTEAERAAKDFPWKTPHGFSQAWYRRRDELLGRLGMEEDRSRVGRGGRAVYRVKP